VNDISKVWKPVTGQPDSSLQKVDRACVEGLGVAGFERVLQVSFTALSRTHMHDRERVGVVKLDYFLADLGAVDPVVARHADDDLPGVLRIPA